MLKRMVEAATLAATVVMMMPATVNAYGAAHVGYTHVGANGVQHYGETVAHGPGGTYEGSHAGAYGTGGAYHTESREATTRSGAYGTTGAYGVHSATEYHYAPSYAGAAYGHAESYHYVR